MPPVVLYRHICFFLLAELFANSCGAYLRQSWVRRGDGPIHIFDDLVEPAKNYTAENSDYGNGSHKIRQLNVDVERHRHILGFEAGYRSSIKARMRGEISHEVGKYFRENIHPTSNCTPLFRPYG